MRATLGRPWQLGSPKTSVCRLEAPEVCFIQLSLRSSSPAAQGQVKVLARLSTGLLWPGFGLSHYITKGKVDSEAGEWESLEVTLPPLWHSSGAVVWTVPAQRR